MSLVVPCQCGKRLNAPEEFRGRKVRCPACQQILTVPLPEAAPVAEEEEEDYFEVVTAAPTNKATEENLPEVVAEEVGPDEPRRPKKRKKKRKPRSEESELARMYMEDAEEEMEREERRARAMGGLNRDDDSGGMTLFGVHVTAGVLGGFGTLLLGIIGFIICAIIKDEEVYPVRLFVGSLVCVVLGAFGLVRALVFGEEE